MLIADYFRKQADVLYSLTRGTTRGAPAEPVMNTVVGSSYVYTVLFRSEQSGAKLRARWWRLAHALSDPYRPERHYMRGPGPKWREKHAANRPRAGDARAECRDCCGALAHPDGRG